jgi:GGDEF domain-containing protein
MFLMLDIDFFKQYNDSQGHQKGDEALQKVAHVLQTACRRSNDLVFRMGGEEMAVLSIVDSAADAVGLAAGPPVPPAPRFASHAFSPRSSVCKICVTCAACTGYGPNCVRCRGRDRRADRGRDCG